MCLLVKMSIRKMYMGWAYNTHFFKGSENKSKLSSYTYLTENKACDLSKWRQEYNSSPGFLIWCPNTHISPNRYFVFNSQAVEVALVTFLICLPWSAELSYPNTHTDTQRTNLSCWPFISPTLFNWSRFHPTETCTQHHHTREKSGKGWQR